MIGEIPGAYAQAFEFPNLKDSDVESDDEASTAELQEGTVAVKLSRETKLHIREPWTKAIIVKLVGRLNGLPIELYEAGVLKQLGEAIGRVLRIDTHTAMEAWGKYARLCVQIDVNKPLINTILIGRFEQAVVYEGIQKLCFSYDRIGHRKEACPYTIRKEEPPEVMAERRQVEQVDNTREMRDDVCAGGMQATPNVSGTGEDEGKYGPWMVVARKRTGQKGTKKSTSFEGTTRSTRDVAPPLESDDAGWAATASNGPPPGFSTSLSFVRPAGLVQEQKDKAFGNSFSPRLPSQAHLPPKNKSRTSVKSMKVIARGMCKRDNPISAAASQDQPNTFTAMPNSFFNHGHDDCSHSAFNFAAIAKPEMDKLSFGKGSQSIRIYTREKKGESHQSHGFGQSQLDGGVEARRSTMGDER
ncbi:hypothetical protein CMV_022009 [Castanea mollissima]|uniref:DUF4283 domain-containing protein n=1 Tax=Castanea mollissima TaxID=60419 RepID=A0A8J4QT93_9ROSI|nr:hypothetical protein CMV_022009 [Castanea mollissima]